MKDIGTGKAAQRCSWICEHGLVGATRAPVAKKISSIVDFCHLYDYVEDLYCEDNGRPSVEPVVLFKIVLI